MNPKPIEKRAYWFLGIYFLVILLVLAFAPYSRAGDLDGSLTVGIGKSVLSRQPFERYGAFGVRYGGETWKAQASGGYWLALAENEKASPFASLQTGVEIEGKSGGTLSVMFGPAWIKNPDSKLAGNFQFHLTFGGGVANVLGYRLMWEWQHFSNAGIKQPNNGRDILSLKLIFPLWTPALPYDGP